MDYFLNTPLGWLSISTSANSLQRIMFLENEPDDNSADPSPIIEQTIIQLDEYFDGKRTSFSVPLKPRGTAFQKSVWEALQQIPFGQTTSYGKLAQILGDPNKVRAIGKANGQNPIPIIIPCHRVIGANDSLVGYSGGIQKKRYLLKHEGAILL